MIGLYKNKVLLQEVNSSIYTSAFLEEKEILSTVLKDLFETIEHIGSTAIQGILAKPIIDIAIGIRNFDRIKIIKQLLQENDYLFLEDNGEPGRYVFIKTKGEICTHHIHVEEYKGKCWNNHIDFKYCLLNSVVIQKEYNELKKNLAQKYADDRKGYTHEKVNFIQGVLTNYRVSRNGFDNTER